MRSAGHSGGFTLLEVLLSVAIMTVILGVATPVFAGFVQRNDLDIATQTIAAMLYRAETYSRGANYDNNWSVDFQAGTVTLYMGTTYASRDSTRDEAYSVPSSITDSFTGDISFTKLTGLPTSTPTITLTSSANASRVITINVKGMVDY